MVEVEPTRQHGSVTLEVAETALTLKIYVVNISITKTVKHE